jgi:hypothetical protein
MSERAARVCLFGLSPSSDGTDKKTLKIQKWVLLHFDKFHQNIDRTFSTYETGESPIVVQSSNFLKQLDLKLIAFDQIQNHSFGPKIQTLRCE